jgi:nucleoside-diphosphate-sugar epimerase
MISEFAKDYDITRCPRGSDFCFDHNIVIHLAGISHDLKNASSSHDYYEVNTEMTKSIFDAFLLSDSRIFIYLSSVKAVADRILSELTEESEPNPVGDYGRSKLFAELYIQESEVPLGKKVFILRPCMIHGPGNTGNLNLLYNFVSKGMPWPLGSYDNRRSYCSIDNLMFIFRELIENQDIPSGVYNVADDIPLSTNEVISIIADSRRKKPRIIKIPKQFVENIAKIGTILNLPVNEERLHKLTDSYVVCNRKLIKAIGKDLPVSSREGLSRTIKSFL